jgi:hypothetical protein
MRTIPSETRNAIQGNQWQQGTGNFSSSTGKCGSLLRGLENFLLAFLRNPLIADPSAFFLAGDAAESSEIDEGAEPVASEALPRCLMLSLMVAGGHHAVPSSDLIVTDSRSGHAYVSCCNRHHSSIILVAYNVPWLTTPHASTAVYQAGTCWSMSEHPDARGSKAHAPNPVSRLFA